MFELRTSSDGPDSRSYLDRKPVSLVHQLFRESLRSNGLSATKSQHVFRAMLRSAYSLATDPAKSCADCPLVNRRPADGFVAGGHTEVQKLPKRTAGRKSGVCLEA